LYYFYLKPLIIWGKTICCSLICIICTYRRKKKLNCISNKWYTLAKNKLPLNLFPQFMLFYVTNVAYFLWVTGWIFCPIYLLNSLKVQKNLCLFVVKKDNNNTRQAITELRLFLDECLLLYYIQNSWDEGWLTSKTSAMDMNM
jgi:hypothetical protein